MSNQYDDARQDAARSTPEPDNEPLSSRARTPLGTTHQLTAKRSQYNQPGKETTMSDENTNSSNSDVQPVDSEPQTVTTPADTTTEPPADTPAPDDTARGKSNREARYRLRAKEAEAKAEEQEKQIAELQAQLKAQQEAYEQEKAAAARAALCSELDKKCFNKDRGIFAMMEGLPDDTLRDIAHAIDMWRWGQMKIYPTGEQIEKMRKIGDGSGTGWKQAF